MHIDYLTIIAQTTDPTIYTITLFIPLVMASTESGHLSLYSYTVQGHSAHITAMPRVVCTL